MGRRRERVRPDTVPPELAALGHDFLDRLDFLQTAPQKGSTKTERVKKKLGKKGRIEKKAKEGSIGNETSEQGCVRGAGCRG